MKLVFFKGGMSLKFEYLPRLYEQSHWKKDTTAVLFKDENFLWAMFYWHQSGHGNVITPITFLMKIALLLGYDKLSWQSAHLPKTQKANTASNNRSWPTCLIPSAHSTPRYFLGLQRHAGHKYAEFQKPSVLIRGKTNRCRNFYLYCFCALFCRCQRFNPSLYPLSPLIICLSRVWFCLFFLWLFVCWFLLGFFSPPFTSLFQQNEKLFYLHVYIECRDNFHNCETWRRSGLCHGTAHAFYLRNGCAKTCGFCKSKWY